MAAEETADETSVDPPSQGESSLRHRLLGPSLTKAGQDSVDQQRVSEIIYNASKGSKFFANEKARDNALTEKINRILARKKQLERLDLSRELRKADEYIATLEGSRDLSQTVIHIDCDAFYAAVEELDRPELKEVPFAVGRGVVTTCNYLARKFGCRSGMASFVAKKLCPQLICLPQNFTKYNAKAEEVRAVLALYDARYESASIDEAYLNITAYCQERQLDPQDVVQQMRKEIQEVCKITVSAGIAANGKLAKISSNQNKPNGQFCIPSDRTSIMDFMKNLPVRKVNGIGRVFERELDAIGIRTVGDIYTHRGILDKLFGEKAFQFLIQTYLGLGRTNIAPAEESERKSVGTERTFGEIQGKEELRKKLRDIAEELEDDLKKAEVKGRTLVLKVKLYTFEVLTRQTVPPFAVSKADDLERFALPMLTKLEHEIPKLRLRLLGLRCTSLVSSQKADVDFFGVKKNQSQNSRPMVPTDEDGWEIWPEEEFEAAAKNERLEEMEEIEKLSQEQEDAEFDQADQEKDQSWECPICQRPQIANDSLFNQHIDSCLSRKAIKEVVKDSSTIGTPLITVPGSSSSAKKRSRPKSNGNADTKRNVKSKSFF